MKKLLCIMLSLIMLISMAACSSQEAQGTTPPAVQDNEEPPADNATELPSYKIGFLYGSYADALGQGFKRAEETAVAELNCEAVWVEGSDEIVAAVENLIQSGVDGIVTYQISGEIIKLCDEAGVYLVLSGTGINDPDLLQSAVNSKYYVGSVMEDNYPAAYAAAQSLYDAGCRNFIYASLPTGFNLQYDERTRGFEDFIADHDDVTLVTAITGMPTDIGATVEQTLTAHPDVDGVLDAFGMPTIMGAIYSTGKQDSVKYACLNVNEGAGEALELGVCTFCCGGQYPTRAFSFTLLYNALNGNDLVPDKSETLLRPFIYVKNFEEYEYFQTVYGEDISDPGYPAEVYRTLATCADFAVFQEYAQNYSLETVKELRK